MVTATATLGVSATAGGGALISLTTSTRTPVLDSSGSTGTHREEQCVPQLMRSMTGELCRLHGRSRPGARTPQTVFVFSKIRKKNVSGCNMSTFLVMPTQL